MLHAARPRLDALLAEGVTTVEIKSGYGLDLENELKQLRVARERIEKHDEVWVPMQMTMTHLQHESYTRLQVRSIEPRERLDRDDFDLRRLESH